MYRVELKEPHNMICPILAYRVPNVPCGVERALVRCLVFGAVRVQFLMYRVELKGSLIAWISNSTDSS